MQLSSITERGVMLFYVYLYFHGNFTEFKQLTSLNLIANILIGWLTTE